MASACARCADLNALRDCTGETFAPVMRGAPVAGAESVGPACRFTVAGAVPVLRSVNVEVACAPSVTVLEISAGVAVKCPAGRAKSAFASAFATTETLRLTGW